MRTRVPDRESGTHDLTSGENYGTVTALFAEEPDRVRLTVEAPEGGLVIFACIVRGTISDTGFDFYLSAAPETTGYKLHYTCDF